MWIQTQCPLYNTAGLTNFSCITSSYFSHREHKDRPLMSLAAVLHHANHTLDSIVLLHSAIDTCDEYSVYHFLLGNLYAVSAPYCFVFFFTLHTMHNCSSVLSHYCYIWPSGRQFSSNLDFWVKAVVKQRLIFQKKKTNLKTTKCCRRNGGFMFSPEVNVFFLIDNPIWRVCSQPTKTVFVRIICTDVMNWLALRASLPSIFGIKCNSIPRKKTLTRT